MAYTPNSLVQRFGGNIEGSFDVWEYTSTDSLASITATGYFTDGGFKGMAVGDMVWVINQSTPTATLCQVTAVTTSTTGGLTQPTGPATIAQSNSTSSDDPLDLLQGGDFTTNPWQLGTSLPFSSTVTTGPDRFFGVGGTAASGLMARASNTDIPGFTAAVAFGRSASDTHTVGLTFGQVVETGNAIRAQGKSVAVSFYAKAGAQWAAGTTSGMTNSALTATLIAGTGVDDTDANLVAGTWTGASTVGQTTITPSTTTSRFVFGGTVPTNATQLGILFNCTPIAASTAGANENVQLMAIGAKLGADNGLYIHREPNDVLAVCQRYLQVVSEPTSGVAVGVAQFLTASGAQVYVPLPTSMRKAPTVSFTAGGFAVMDSAGGAHTVSSGSAVGTPTGLTLTVTAATTLTAGTITTLQGRTTGSGSIVARAGYEG